eukprot:1393462-Rhodomonas_salina.1
MSHVSDVNDDGMVMVKYDLSDIEPSTCLAYGVSDAPTCRRDPEQQGPAHRGGGAPHAPSPELLRFRPPGTTPYTLDPRPETRDPRP